VSAAQRGRVRGSPLHHISVAVSDLERSTRFYGDILGLRPTLRMTLGGPQTAAIVGVPASEHARVQLLDGGTTIGQVELVEWSGNEGGPPPDRSVTRPGAMILAFEVAGEDLLSLHARLSREGFRCRSLPARVDLPGYGYAIAFITEDPDGNPVELMTLARERVPAPPPSGTEACS
jgi:catechol 2,3-dioxygenase-like lactoylglutathione lyase family enzyme